MTPNSPISPESLAEASAGAKPRDDDQHAHAFGYGHGRMPLFMKIAWIGFLAFATWYVVRFLLTSVGDELGG
jgi:hypothetical protein